MLTQERLKELLHYDPETGVFHWRVARKKVKVGDVAGGRESWGYIRITVDQRSYKAHRLAWLYVHGRWPDDQLDHINNARDDNRLENLRQATPTLNGQNQRRPQSGNASGYLGVSLDKLSGKWRAHIKANGKNRCIGYFNCPTAAYLLGYLPAKRKLHEFGTL